MKPIFYRPLWIIFLLPAFFFVGCEGSFIGDKAENSEILNGISRLKIRSISGTDYLVVLNSNSQFHAAHGNLQFYTITDLSNPQKSTTLTSLSLPPNANDFEILDTGTPTLYIPDRNTDEILVYELVGSAFQAKADAKGEATAIKTCVNPMNIQSYTRSLDSKVLLAITCRRSGVIALMDPDSLSYVNPVTDLNLSTSADFVEFSSQKIFGSQFYMEPRQSQVSGEDDEIGVSTSRQQGVGISESEFYGTANDIFVAYNSIQNAFYSFRFTTFQNAANLAWDLPDFRNSETLESGVRREGTDENGFRGLGIDGNKNIYLSNRADNSIYKIPPAEVEADKEDDRNTKGIEENTRSYRLAVDLDADITDEIFPRLGHLTVERINGQDATALWVLGLGESKVYRMDLTTNPITVIEKVVGQSPQRILGVPVGAAFQYIYVGDVTGNTISVLDATTLDVVRTLSND